MRPDIPPPPPFLDGLRALAALAPDHVAVADREQVLTRTEL
eukprot:gene13860-18360_t